MEQKLFEELKNKLNKTKNQKKRYNILMEYSGKFSDKEIIDRYDKLCKKANAKDIFDIVFLFLAFVELLILIIIPAASYVIAYIIYMINGELTKAQQTIFPNLIAYPLATGLFCLAPVVILFVVFIIRRSKDNHCLNIKNV